MKKKIVLMAFALLFLTNAAMFSINQHVKKVSMTLAAVERAEADSEYSGVMHSYKLKRIEGCIKSGNSLTINKGGDLSYSRDKWSDGDASDKHNTVQANTGSRKVVQGEIGYYTDCRFAMSSKCDRAEINFDCR